MTNTKRRIILISIVSAVLALIIILIVSQRNTSTGAYKLVINTIPRDTTITFNGKKYQSKLDLRLDPGEYTVSFERYGFRSITHDVIIKDEDVSFHTALDPVTEDAFKWQEQHQDLYLIVEAEKQALAVKDIPKMVEDFPLLTKLPIIRGSHRIGSRNNEDGTISIVIHSSPDMLSLAIDQLKDFRFDLSKYKFEYMDNRNLSEDLPIIDINPFILEKDIND